MRENCNHFTNIKLDGLKNLILKYPTENCKFIHYNKKQISIENKKIWICLICGIYSCGKLIKNKCILKHCYQSDHSLIANPFNYKIVCIKCEIIITEKNIKSDTNLVIIQLFEELKKNLIKIKNNIKNLNNKKIIIANPFETENNIILKDISYESKNIFGLNNLGNTCFFNSIIQCLNVCYEWKEYLRNNFDKIKNYNFWYRYFILLNSNDIIKNPCSILNIWGEKNSIYKKYKQQDAQELLRYMIDLMNEKLSHLMNLTNFNTEYKPIRTKIEKIFGTYLCNYIKCLNCNKEKVIFDLTFDLVIDININENLNNFTIQSKNWIQNLKNNKINQSNNGYFKLDSLNFDANIIPYNENKELYENVSYKNPDTNIDLVNYLDQFFDYEIINNKENYYKCDNCVTEGLDINYQAFRKYFIYKLPKILTICLKRFKQEGVNNYSKNNININYPEILSLENYLLSNLISKKNRFNKLKM